MADALMSQHHSQVTCLKPQSFTVSFVVSHLALGEVFQAQALCALVERPLTRFPKKHVTPVLGKLR
jgi:hypothetical protein